MEASHSQRDNNTEFCEEHVFLAYTNVKDNNLDVGGGVGGDGNFDGLW